MNAAAGDDREGGRIADEHIPDLVHRHFDRGRGDVVSVVVVQAVILDVVDFELEIAPRRRQEVLAFVKEVPFFF